MDTKRGVLVVGGSVALLVSAVALTLWARKRGMTEEEVKAIDAKGKPITKPKAKTPVRKTHAKNGKVTA